MVLVIHFLKKIMMCKTLGFKNNSQNGLSFQCSLVCLWVVVSSIHPRIKWNEFNRVYTCVGLLFVQGWLTGCHIVTVSPCVLLGKSWSVRTLCHRCLKQNARAKRGYNAFILEKVQGPQPNSGLSECPQNILFLHLSVQPEGNVVIPREWGSMGNTHLSSCKRQVGLYSLLLHRQGSWN